MEDLRKEVMKNCFFFFFFFFKIAKPNLVWDDLKGKNFEAMFGIRGMLSV